MWSELIAHDQVIGGLEVKGERDTLHGLGQAFALNRPRVLHLAPAGVDPPILRRAGVRTRDRILAAVDRDVQVGDRTGHDVSRRIPHGDLLERAHAIDHLLRVQVEECDGKVCHGDRRVAAGRIPRTEVAPAGAGAATRVRVRVELEAEAGGFRRVAASLGLVQVRVRVRVGVGLGLGLGLGLGSGLGLGLGLGRVRSPGAS